jgi:hypothetical protein
METNMPTVRVSVMRCDPSQFAEFRKMMAESITVLEPGIRQMRGLIHLYTGEDEAVNSLAQVSVWRTLEDAKQLDTFQPMLDLGKEFTSKGATFERQLCVAMGNRAGGLIVGRADAGRSPTCPRVRVISDRKAAIMQFDGGSDE